MITILVVEDESNIRFLIKVTLEHKGYRILEAANGMEALKQLESNTVDLMITDLRMPEMSGVQLIVTVQDLYPGIPIVVETAHPRLVAEASNEIKVDGVIYKPFMRSQFIALVEKALKPKI
jgi:DNA-binding NtrC family response regulator